MEKNAKAEPGNRDFVLAVPLIASPPDVAHAPRDFEITRAITSAFRPDRWARDT